MKERGCLYVAFGRPYLIQALNSFATLRRASPGVAACILTNVFRDVPPGVDQWDKSRDVWLFAEDSDSNNRNYKTQLSRFTPFRKTLYLDCDTEILRDITPMFGFLEYWDLALHLKDRGYSEKKAKGRQTVLNGTAAVFELPHWNSGVILFDTNPRVEKFFGLWHKYFKEGAIQYDQVALVEALFRAPCRVLSLDARWNSGHSWAAKNPDQAQIILHYMYRFTEQIGQRLLALDSKIYGPEDPSDTGFKHSTSAFLIKRRERNLQRSRPQWAGVLAELRRRLVGRLRRPK